MILWHGALRRLRSDAARRWLLVPAVVLAASIVTWVAPQRDGPLAAFEVLVPVIYGLTALLVLVAAARRSLALLLAVLITLGVGMVGYRTPPATASVPTGTTLTVMTWNVHGDDLGEMGFAEVTARVRPDVVLLEEARLRRGDAGLVAAWPYRLTYPRAATPPGMVILSRLPIEADGILDRPPGAWDKPRAPWIRVSLDGMPLTIVGVHLTFPFSSLPCPYCPDARDTEVRALASFAASRGSGALVVAGDFNMTEREPAHADMARVLTEVVPEGGATWKPLARSWFPPILRLDFVFVSADIAATARVECAGSRSDHCPVAATLGIRAGGSG